MKLRTLTLLFCVSFLIVTIAGWGNRRKKEKNGRQKDKDDDLVDKWASNDAIDDDNDDDDYEYGVDVDYDDDDDVKGDKHWIKKPKCPEIKIGKTLRKKLSHRQIRDFKKNWCPTPKEVENGNIKTSCGRGCGRKATIKCHAGFVLRGKKKRVCMKNRDWSGMDPICLTECGLLPDPQYGTVTQTGLFFGNVATYNCSKFYELDGLDERKCELNGNWSGNAPTCKPIDFCVTNPCLNGATCASYLGGRTCTCVSGYSGDDCGTNFFEKYADVVTFSVDASVSIEQIQFITDFIKSFNIGYQRWSNGCGLLPAPEYGTVTLTIPFFGVVVTYNCNKFYELDGPDERKCELNGNWSGNAPVCNPIDFCVINPCLNGATCAGYLGGRTCTCVSGYSGIDCETRDGR